MEASQKSSQMIMQQDLIERHGALCVTLPLGAFGAPTLPLSCVRFAV